MENILKKTADVGERRQNAPNRPLLIAGPCSAETPEQIRRVVEELLPLQVPYIRVGVWKPRTRPGTFEGMGVEALKWLKELKDEVGVAFAIEVANPTHVELALQYGMDLLWIGARTTVNPFAVQEIADALKGVKIPVLVKNPINPDLALWMGGIERIEKADVSSVGAIHRGFSLLEERYYRNAPLWQIPLELKSLRPDIPLICDPSHIGGKRDLIADIAQKALDLNYDGLMIEVHPNPDKAWSDAAQQITSARLQQLMTELVLRDSTFRDTKIVDRLAEIRRQIDHADREILEAIARRMKLVEQVGSFKRENNVAIFQIQRWKEVFGTRPLWGEKLQLDKEFVMEIYRQIHQASIKLQTEILHKNEQPS
jgi:chorismate mutase